MSSARPYLQEDYKDLVTWWTGYGWPVIPSEMLPGTGFIKPGVVAGFLVVTNSPIWLFEWVIGNPESSRKDRTEGIEDILDMAIEWSKTSQVPPKWIMHMTENDSLIDTLKRNNFSVTSTGITHLMRSI